MTAIIDITGREMKGWVMIRPEGVETAGDAKAWIDRSLAFVETLPPK